MQQGVGVTEEGLKWAGWPVDSGSQFAQNEPKHPQPFTTALLVSWRRHDTHSYLIIMLLSVWPPKVCVCAHRYGAMFALGSFDGHITDE